MGLSSYNKKRKNLSNCNNKINELINEVDTDHACSIPENAIDKIYNAIVRIEKENGDIGTGFFMKIKTNDRSYNVLFTCHHVITNGDIDSKKLYLYFLVKKIKK